MNWWILPTGGVVSGRVCPAACAAALFYLDFGFFLDKVVELVVEGLVSTGPTPSSYIMV